MTPDDLDTLVTAGEIDTVLVAFTDNYGRLLGKRLDARFFLDETLGHGTHACDYLLTVDMEMEPVPGYDYASWELGYGDFHLVADLTTLARAGWTDSSAIVLCDVVDVHTHEPVAVAAALDAGGTARARRRARLLGQGGIGTRVLPVRGHLPRGAPQGVRGTRAGRLVHRGLPPAPGRPGRGLRRRGAARARRHRDPRREFQGRMGSRPARTQHPIRRGAHDGRPTHRDEARDEGIGRGPRAERDVHGQADHRGGGQQQPPAPEPVGRRGAGQCLRRGWRAQRRVPMVPRRLDGGRRRLHGLLRADDQLVQALRRRFLGADPHRLVAGQSNCRLPRGRRRSEPAHRVPDPGRRLQPVSRLHRRAGERTARDRGTDRAPTAIRRRRLRRGRPPACPDDTGACERPLRNRVRWCARRSAMR